MGTTIVQGKELRVRVRFPARSQAAPSPWPLALRDNVPSRPKAPVERYRQAVK